MKFKKIFQYGWYPLMAAFAVFAYSTEKVGYLFILCIIALIVGLLGEVQVDLLRKLLKFYGYED